MWERQHMARPDKRKKEKIKDIPAAGTKNVEFPRFGCSFALAARFMDYLILAGTSNSEFGIKESGIVHADDIFTFFYRADSEKTAYDFLLIWKTPDALPQVVPLQFPAGSQNLQIQLRTDRLPPDLTGAAAISRNLRWQFLNFFMPFSESWHAALEKLPLDFFSDIDASGLEKKDAALLLAVRSVKEKYNPQGFFAVIDGYDGARVSGWAKKNDSAESLAISVYQDGRCLKKKFKSDTYRADIRNAGFGTGSYSFSVQPLDCANSFTCFQIEEARTGQIIAFRFFPVEMPAGSEYELVLEDFAVNLQGWCVDKAVTNRIFHLAIYLDGLFFTGVDNSDSRGDLLEKGISGGQGGFHIDTPFPYLPSGKHILKFRFPNGAFSQDFEFDVKKKPAPLRDLSILNKPVSIIIPVYNAPEDLEICLESLFANTPENANVIIVNDASPDPRVAEMLKRHADRKDTVILTNEKNLGFSGSINRGIEAAGSNDVILLNSDTRVTPKWLQSLLLTAASRPKVATVTPMSNRAGAFSAPEIGNANELPPGADEDRYSRAFRRASVGSNPSVPTGNGFCMFVSRACIDEIGLFDQQAFPRGYGEENDFCMRAARRGWLNLVDDRTYIYHESGKSFKETKKDLMIHGMSVLESRYPEYRPSLGIFSLGGAMLAARHASRMAWHNWRKLNLPRVLYVISTTQGGTPQTNMDLMGEISASAQCHLLQCNAETMWLYILEDGKLRLLYEHRLANPLDPYSHASAEYDAHLAAWIFELDIDIVHIRHFLWQSINLAKTARQMGCRVVYSLHDFYTLSPNHNLVDDSGVFLGEDFCEAGSPYRGNLWQNPDQKDLALPVEKKDYISFWRQRFQDRLACCDSFVTTSESVRNTVIEGLEKIPASFQVIPHGRNFRHFYNLQSNPLPGEKIRIVVPGNINYIKGLGYLQSLAAYDKARYNILEIHVLGHCMDAAKQDFIMHGAYSRDNLHNALCNINPHAAVIFSICTETWCHTLTEMWACGVPVFVFDIGTVSQRMRRAGAGWILPFADIPELYASIRETMQNGIQQSEAGCGIRAWQTGAGSINTTDLMAARYYELYRKITAKDLPGQKNRPVVAVCGKWGIASSHVRLFNFARNLFQRDASWLRMNGPRLLQSVKAGLVDAVILQRTFLPAILADDLIGALRDSGIPFAFEMDDDLFSIPADKQTPAYRAYLPFLEKLVKNASLVIVSTPFLKDKISEYNKNISVFETKLDGFVFESSPAVREEDGTIRALYYGTTTHGRDLGIVLPVFEKLARQYNGLRLRVIGIDENTQRYAAIYDFLETVPISAKNGPYPYFIDFLKDHARYCDFGIAPLEDTVFNNSKSNLKLLEYGALGLPCVASNNGPYREMRDFPHIVLCENTMKEWENGIKKMISGKNDFEPRQCLREYVIKNYFLSEKDYKKYDNLIIGMIKNTGRQI